MYLVEFLKSLSQIPKSPSTEEILKMEGNIISLGYKEVESEGKVLEERNVESIKKSLVYTHFPDIKMLESDITEIIDYIQYLNAEIVDKRWFFLDKQEADAVIYEAIWILDVFSELPADKMILQMDGGGIAQLSALYGNNADNDCCPILLWFGLPVWRDAFLAKVRWVVKRYISARMSCFDLTAEEYMYSYDFDTVMKVQLERYCKSHQYNSWRAGIETGIENEAFDDFVQQMYSISNGSD